jgi:GNAT superfamily N-acetyltransferase
MSSESHNIRIAPATSSDMGALLRMARHEAEYERMTDHFTATEQRLREALFGSAPAAEVLLAWDDDDHEPVGFALFFTTFSTYSAQRGLYLEDLFVEAPWRGRGVGRKLLAHLAALALERGHHGITWSVFKWNDPAIRFYRGTGAEQLDAWHYFHLAGEAMQTLAAESTSH